MKHEFWKGLSLTKRLYDQSLQPVTGQYSLTRMELDILLFLANNPNYDTATDMISRRGLTKSHVSSSVQHLVELGYLERFYREDNRKVVHLKVLSPAEEVIEAGRQAQSFFFSKLYEGFTPHQQKQVEDAADRIIRNAAEALEELEHAAAKE